MSGALRIIPQGRGLLAQPRILLAALLLLTYCCGSTAAPAQHKPGRPATGGTTDPEVLRGIPPLADLGTAAPLEVPGPASSRRTPSGVLFAGPTAPASSRARSLMQSAARSGPDRIASNMCIVSLGSSACKTSPNSRFRVCLQPGGWVSGAWHGAEGASAAGREKAGQGGGRRDRRAVPTARSRVSHSRPPACPPICSPALRPA